MSTYTIVTLRWDKQQDNFGVHYLVINHRIYRDGDLWKEMREYKVSKSPTESLVRISWGGTSKAPVLRSTHLNIPVNTLH